MSKQPKVDKDGRKKIYIWSSRLCREKNVNNKDNKDKNSKKKH